MPATGYRDRLGLTPTIELAEQEMNIFRPFISYRSRYTGTAQNTAAIWIADDFDSGLARLRDRAVTLETYEMPEFQWTDGVATSEAGARSLWFKDSEGNILCMTELPPGIELPGA